MQRDKYRCLEKIEEAIFFKNKSDVICTNVPRLSPADERSDVQSW